MSKELKITARAVSAPPSYAPPIVGVITVRIQQFFSKQLYIGVFLPLIILALWQTACTNEWVEPIFLPPPLKVVKSFWYMLWEQELLNDIWVSIFIVGQGFIYGAIAALSLGIAAGLSRKVELFFASTLNTLRHIPSIAWIPLIVVWLGLGAPAKVLILAKSVFFPVFLNTLQGIRNIDKNYIELAQVLKLSRSQFISRVIIPAILPQVFVSLR